MDQDRTRSAATRLRTTPIRPGRSRPLRQHWRRSLLDMPPHNGHLAFLTNRTFFSIDMQNPKPSCIVLGGGGFIGLNLCRRLVASGHKVRAFGRRCLFPQELRGAEWYQGDFTDPAALVAAMETFDVAFHLVHSSTPQGTNLDIAGDVRKNV